MVRRIAYDTEFIEDGRTIDLVSIALIDVDASASTYYAVSAEFDQRALLGRPWLAENVAAHLPFNWAPIRDPAGSGPTMRGYLTDLNLEHPDVRPRTLIRDQVVDFILGPGEPVELWADYGAYDHVVLHWLWGGMAGRPDGMPMFSHDVQQQAAMLGVLDADLPCHDGTPHYALDDARHTAACVRYLDDIPFGRRRLGTR